MERSPVGPIKLDHLQKCSQIFRSDQTEMIRSICFLTEISAILGCMESAQQFFMMIYDHTSLGLDLFYVS